MRATILFAAAFMASASAQAGVIATQTVGQGNYPTSQLGGGSWGAFTSDITAQNSLVRIADFSGLNASSAYDAVFVNQELGNTLSSAEISALTAFIGSGKKAVFVGENGSWTNWNASMTQVTGGSLDGSCSHDSGTALVANQLTTGITATVQVCGSVVSGGTSLFSNGLASLFQVGAGQVLMLGDSNFLDDGNRGLGDNAAFGVNIASWLNTPLTQAVPEPGMIGLFGLGALALLAPRRRRTA